MKTIIVNLALALASLSAQAETPIYHNLDDYKSFEIIFDTFVEINAINDRPGEVAALFCLYKGDETYRVVNHNNSEFVVRIHEAEDASVYVEIPIKKVRKTLRGNIRIWAENMKPVECIVLRGYLTNQD